MKNKNNSNRKGATMKIRIYATVCLATVTMAATAFSTLAQDATPDALVQQARQTADLLTATQAQQQFNGQLNNGNYSNLATAPASNFPQANLFGGQAPAIYSHPFSGFNAEAAKINNATNKQIMELVGKIKEAESDEVKLELKEEVKQLLTAQYDAYLEQHEAPLKQLEARLDKLRTEFESRKSAKDDLVKLRLDTIWYDAMGLGWPNGRSVGGVSIWGHSSAPFATPAALQPPSTNSPRSPLLPSRRPLPSVPGVTGSSSR